MSNQMEVAMLDPDLLHSINLRRCFAFIGAGPSAELGYPSWAGLAERVRDHVLSNVPTADHPSYERFMKNRDFPALLRQAEVDLGSRNAIIKLVKSILRPSGTAPTRSIYDYLAKWPFACYLTTNFDDEISRSLTRQGTALSGSAQHSHRPITASRWRKSPDRQDPFRPKSPRCRRPHVCGLQPHSNGIRRRPYKRKAETGL